ncbi:MAG: hypothetical protein K2M65_05160, partial [Muribaculaceae bacterium]|nr:hypothetical protein [Muribaculaceae bacterium]
MNINKYISVCSLAGLMLFGATSCSEEELGPSIFPEVPDTVDPGSYTYKFDTWLNQNFRDVYNLNLFYKMKDVESDQDYNLVPATLDNAMDLALLTKYLWFDAYAELSSPEFLKQYGPRIIHLIGSPAYNPTAGTEILGLAEGGLKVSLFKVNAMEINNINQMNEYYFRTMHHEFGHILHQTKSYPTEFNLLSNGLYDTNNWQSKDPGQMLSLGFITPYSSAENREDFAETIANFVTRTQDQLDLLIWAAGQNYSTGITPAEGEQPDNEAPFYAFYFYKDNAARMNDERTYFLRFVDRPTIGGNVDYRVGYMEGDNMPAGFATGEFLTSVDEIEG